MIAQHSADWPACYAHPILVVETFVDPERFRGTVYRAVGWTELGQTTDNGRKARDYYEAHDRPRPPLRVRTGARHPPHPAGRAPRTGARAGRGEGARRRTLKADELRALAEYFRAAPRRPLPPAGTPRRAPARPSPGISTTW